MPARYRPPGVPIAAAIAVVALALGGCGSSGGSSASAGGAASASGPAAGGSDASAAPTPLPPPLPHPTRATLILDFTPNAVHAGIYRALAAGYYRREHIDLQVVAAERDRRTAQPGRAPAARSSGWPTAATSPPRSTTAADDEAVMAIVQRPVGGLIALASEHLRSPAQLQGRTVGITGVPSDLAVLDTEVRHAGGDPAKVHVVTVGFNGAQALLAGRVAAFTGFVPDDGVGLRGGRPSDHALLARPQRRPRVPRAGGVHQPRARALGPRAGARLPRRHRARLRGHAARSGPLARRAAARQPLAAARADRRLAARLPAAVRRRRRARFGTIQPAHIAELSRWMLANHLSSASLPFVRYGSDAFLPAS